MRKVIGVLIIFFFVTTSAYTIAGEGLVCPTNVKKEACPHNVDGLKALDAKKYDEAAKHFEEAVKADPKFVEAHYNLALALHNKGDHQGATKHFKMAADMSPGNEKIQKSEVLRKHLGK